jgi:membrane-bound lytic murein transglycosylase D
MKLRYLLYPVLFLYLLSGCSHVSLDHTKSDESNLEGETALSPSREYSIEKMHQITPLMEMADTQTGDLSEADERQMDSAAGSKKKDGSDINNHENGLEGTVAPVQKVQTDLDDALDLCQLSQGYWQQGELENAVDALDRAYALILSADTSDQPKLIQQKEDLRFMISKRILEIYASRRALTILLR